MADDTIDSAALILFEKYIRAEVQQQRSYLRNAVTIHSGDVGEGRRYTIQNKLAFSARGARNPNTTRTPTNEPAYNFRWLSTSGHDLSAQWDRRDEWLLADMQNPKSPLVMDFARAWARLEDDTIIAALEAATVVSEADRSGTVAMPAGNQIAHGTTGLTLDKMLTVNRKFLEAEVDPSLTRWWVISPAEVEDLQEITEYKSLDFNLRAGLMSGQPLPFMGFNFIVSNRLTVTTNITNTLVFAAPGIIFAPSIYEVRYDELPAYRYDRQLYAYAEVGGLRLYDEMVYWVGCDTTAV